MTVLLQHNDFKLTLAPKLGGSVLSLRHGEIDILRSAKSMTEANWDGRDSSAFPLVPFVGRIANGKFTINQLTVSLPQNMPPEPHAIHGFGWQTNWSCETSNQREATLVQKHSSDAWPWDYEARQHFTLLDDGMLLKLSIHNLGQTPMPAGLGWHPYFPRKDARLVADTRRIWLASDENTADRTLSCEPGNSLNRLTSVADLDIDHAFSMGDRHLRMSWPNRTVDMLLGPLFQTMIAYVPPGEDYFCVEPASHAPNAVNMDLTNDVSGLKLLKPGAILSGTVRLFLTNTV